MKWIKLFTSLHRHIGFRRLSPAARLTFYVALELAGDLEQDGAIAVRGLGPVSISEISGEVLLSERVVSKALDDLIGIGFMSKREDGAYVVSRFSEKIGPDDPTASERKRRQRERNGHGDVTRDTSVTTENVTVAVTRDVTALEEEIEKEEEDYRVAGNAISCRCLVRPRSLARDLEPEDLVPALLSVFANRRKPGSQARHLASWTGQVRAMLAQGHTAREIWDAFATAHADGRHAPTNTTTAAWAALRLASGGRPRLSLVESEPLPPPFASFRHELEGPAAS